MPDKPFGHLTVEADKIAVQRGGVYHGGVLLASGGAATVAVYDGLDSTTGTLIDFFNAADGYGAPHVLERGIDVREGLYVALGSNVGAFTVYYEPPTGKER